jgi:hypothetical protein
LLWGSAASSRKARFARVDRTGGNGFMCAGNAVRARNVERSAPAIGDWQIAVIQSVPLAEAETGWGLPVVSADWPGLRAASSRRRPMTSKADFTEEEWTRLKRAPFIAGMAISLADPGGPIEAIKETAATLRTVTGAAESGARGELVDAVGGEVADEARQRKSPLSGFKPTGATAGTEILDELREVEPDRVSEGRAGGGRCLP